MNPVPAASLPEWRKELAEYRKAGKPGPLSKHQWIALEELDALRWVIEAGKGEAMVLESVARHMPTDDLGTYPAGLYDGYGDRGDWKARDMSGGMFVADKELMLGAIDAAGTALIKATK